VSVGCLAGLKAAGASAAAHASAQRVLDVAGRRMTTWRKRRAAILRNASQQAAAKWRQRG
jgi:hypothetical protein